MAFCARLAWSCCCSLEIPPLLGSRGLRQTQDGTLSFQPAQFCPPSAQGEESKKGSCTEVIILMSWICSMKGRKDKWVNIICPFCSGLWLFLLLLQWFCFLSLLLFMAHFLYSLHTLILNSPIILPLMFSPPSVSSTAYLTFSSQTQKDFSCHC